MDDTIDASSMPVCSAALSSLFLFFICRLPSLVCHNPTMQPASYLLAFSCIFGLVVVVAKLAHCGALAGFKQLNGRIDM